MTKALPHRAAIELLMVQDCSEMEVRMLAFWGPLGLIEGLTPELVHPT